MRERQFATRVSRPFEISNQQKNRQHVEEQQDTAQLQVQDGKDDGVTLSTLFCLVRITSAGRFILSASTHNTAAAPTGPIRWLEQPL